MFWRFNRLTNWFVELHILDSTRPLLTDFVAKVGFDPGDGRRAAFLTADPAACS
jgi:hypothetical protein